ncbi:MAG: hypothetical protein U1F35_08000 [Steroidobacteraceae bacterium]
MRLIKLAGVVAVVASVTSAIAAELPQNIPDISGKALTVHGPVDPSTLGRTLMHEHIFINFQLAVPSTRDHATDEEVARQKLELSNLAAVRSGVWNPDNDFLGDFATAVDEISQYKRGGGGTIVEVSGIRLGRDPWALYRASNASGLNIVMGAGWYQKRYHPANMDQLAERDDGHHHARHRRRRGWHQCALGHHWRDRHQRQSAHAQ